MKPLLIASKIGKNRIFQHVLFWVLAYWILLNHFATSSEITKIDHVYTVIFLISLIIPCYINLLILVPRFFQKRQYFIYFLLIAILIILSVEFNILSFEYLADLIFPGYYLISYYDHMEIAKYMVVFVSLTMLLSLSKSWFQLRESEARMNVLEKEKLKLELKALKTQIDPHFLFNSLNSIYSLIIKKSDQAGEAVLRLSDAMRYMIYEANAEKVPLGKEVDFLKDYLATQQLRTSDKDEITFKIEGEVTDQKIAPLLFIPVIENSFKHGIKGDISNAFVHIILHIEHDFLRLSVENNKGKAENIEQKEGGFGLENLKKRLDLIYPHKHKLVIREKINSFSVTLEIQLK